MSNLSKGQTVFAHPENIETEAHRIFSELESENTLQGLLKTDYCRRLSYFFSECNVLHPFREGNGRTQKLFFSEMVVQSGYRIEWKELSIEDHLKGVIDGYHHRFDTLATIFERIIK